MKNNFDLKGYMKQNQVGSYQQLNEMWYQDINQALGDFNVIKEEDEMKEAKDAFEVHYSDGIRQMKKFGNSSEAMSFAKELIQNKKRLQFVDVFKAGPNFNSTADTDAVVAWWGNGSFMDNKSKSDPILKSKKISVEGNLEEKGDVKSLGDAGKMAHANTRTNLGRHRSSDTLDKQVAKDHDKKTVVGAKAAAYKAPHMKEEESEKEKAMYANTDPNITDPINQEDIFAGSDKAKWDNYGNETSEWDTEIAGQTVKGWTAEETQGGAIAWQNPKYPNAHIYATPGWDGVDGIAFELHDSEDGYMDEPKLQKVVGAGTDLWKTKEGYMALMAKAFTVVEKMLTPSDNMEEDHGRQIDHDKNDNIAKDHSEFEDTVYEDAQDWNHTWEEDIMDLLDDGVSKPEILTHFKDILKNADSRMEESIEDEDPFGSIKTGIDKITQGDDEDFIDDDKLDRFYDMGGRQLTKAADALLDDGFSKREIIDYLQNYM